MTMIKPVSVGLNLEPKEAALLAEAGKVFKKEPLEVLQEMMDMLFLELEGKVEQKKAKKTQKINVDKVAGCLKKYAKPQAVTIEEMTAAAQKMAAERFARSTK
jgi:hypothetical protein